MLISKDSVCDHYSPSKRMFAPEAKSPTLAKKVLSPPSLVLSDQLAFGRLSCPTTALLPLPKTFLSLSGFRQSTSYIT